MKKKQLFQLYEDYLGDRVVLDKTGTPIYLSKAKAAKFKKYNESDLKNRFRYLNSIDDGLKSPDEIWLSDKRYLYLKKFKNNVVLLADIENDGVISFFNIITNPSDSYMNKKRNGFLIYHK